MFNFDPQGIDPEQRRIAVDAVGLDCESPQTARSSVAKILRLSPDRLVTFLRDFDFEEVPENFRLTSENQGELLLKTILFNLNCEWGFSHSSWFHLARCAPTESFQDGLLPLPDVIHKLWEFLFHINSYGLPKSKWETFKARFESSRLGHSTSEMKNYHERMSHQHHHGPNGVLIGDLDVIVALGQDGFFRTPEIVHTICTAFLNEFNHPIHNDFLKATKPCVVKFKTSLHSQRYLSKALVYLYELEQPNSDFLEYLDISYIGNGIPIHADHIQSRRFLDPRYI